MAGRYRGSAGETALKVDVIVVNYYSEDHTSQCIRSILGTSLAAHDLRFHIEDNGSAAPFDLSVNGNDVRVHKNKTNVGFARAVNAAARRSDAPFILLANPDTRFCDGPWDELLQYMNAVPSVGVLGPLVLNIDGSLQGSARAFPSPSTLLFGRKSPLRHWFPKSRFALKNVLDSQRRRAEPMEVDWVSGACMMIRRAAFEAVGGFDERYFLFWEDADLCFRLRQLGWRTVHHPAASVVHLIGASRRRRRWTSQLLFHQSAYRFFLRLHADPGPLLRGAVLCALGFHLLISFLWDKPWTRSLPTPSPSADRDPQWF
ncbi:MAG: glycosyl transferase family 2 [Desulfacinum sp.]|jgi:hypothetical protein|nr:glycosyl transferase family 2 [Desulfacinum sp.]